MTMLLLVRSPLCEAQFTNSIRLATIRRIIHCLEAAGTVIRVAMLVVFVETLLGNASNESEECVYLSLGFGCCETTVTFVFKTKGILTRAISTGPSTLSLSFSCPTAMRANKDLYPKGIWSDPFGLEIYSNIVDAINSSSGMAETSFLRWSGVDKVVERIKRRGKAGPA
jgi:hypothetical protein